MDAVLGKRKLRVVTLDRLRAELVDKRRRKEIILIWEGVFMVEC